MNEKSAKFAIIRSHVNFIPHVYFKEENEERRRIFNEGKMKEQLLTVKALGSTNFLIDFAFLIPPPGFRHFCLFH